MVDIKEFFDYGAKNQTGLIIPHDATITSPNLNDVVSHMPLVKKITLNNDFDLHHELKKLRNLEIISNYRGCRNSSGSAKDFISKNLLPKLHTIGIPIYASKEELDDIRNDLLDECMSNIKTIILMDDAIAATDGVDPTPENQLYFGKWLMNSIPPNVHTIELGFEFNTPLDHILLTNHNDPTSRFSSIQEFNGNRGFNHSIEPLFGSSLSNLKKIVMYNGFNQPLPPQHVIHQVKGSLEYINFGNDFNQDISNLRGMPFIRYIGLGREFQQEDLSVIINGLPSLEKLKLHENYQHDIFCLLRCISLCELEVTLNDTSLKISDGIKQHPWHAKLYAFKQKKPKMKVTLGRRLVR